MARAALRTSPAILASGGIVVAAMLVLGLADFNATREMGPILALGIVVMMAVGLTLMPALLVAFGRRAFWPSIPQVEPEAPAVGPGWRRVSDLVRRHPRPLALGCAALLALGALGNLEGRDYLDLSQQYRNAPDVRPGPGARAQALPAGPRGAAGPGHRPRRSRSRSATSCAGPRASPTPTPTRSRATAS